MELKFSRKFLRQIKRYSRDKKLFRILAKKIKHIQSASGLSEIGELVRIRKTSAHFRIKIKITEHVSYRIGIRLLNNVIWFACIENDKKRFYRQFP